MKPNTRGLVRNLAILQFVALPLCLGLIWLSSVVRLGSRAAPLGDALATGAFYFLAFFVPVLLGGLLHQSILLLLRSAVLRRLASVLLSPLVFMAVLAFQDFEPIREYVVPILLSLAVYGGLSSVSGRRGEPAAGDVD